MRKHLLGFSYNDCNVVNVNSLLLPPIHFFPYIIESDFTMRCD